MTNDQQQSLQAALEHERVDANSSREFVIGNKTYKVWKPTRKAQAKIDDLVQRDWIKAEDDLPQKERIKQLRCQSRMMARTIAYLRFGSNPWLMVTGLVYPLVWIKTWWILRTWNTSEMVSYVEQAYDPTPLTLFFYVILSRLRSNTPLAVEMAKEREKTKATTSNTSQKQE